MKSSIALFILLISFGLQVELYGQTTVEITGTVKSPQGALQGAEITFLNSSDEFQGNCISGPDGKFKSQSKMQIGKVFKLRISSNGYEVFEKTYQVERTGNAGEFMLKRKMLTISGFVRDSIQDKALANAQIFFYDGSSLIQTRSSNNLGYFDVETNFTYGQKITIRVSKDSFYPKEQTLTFTSEGRNSLPDILLPKYGDRGLRAFITVVDKKNGKPVKDFLVRYMDKKRSTFIDTIVSTTNPLELKIYQQPGTKLDIEIRKSTYITIKEEKTLSEEAGGNKFAFELVKDRRSALGPVLLIGGGTAAVISAGMYFSSKAKYEDYKDFSNEHRESDYQTAQSRLDIAVIAGGVAVAAFLSYAIYKITEKNKAKAKPTTGLKRFSFQTQSYAYGTTPIAGLAYHF